MNVVGYKDLFLRRIMNAVSSFYMNVVGYKG